MSPESEGKARPSGLASEKDRIVGEYERRDRDLPRGLYSFTRQDNLFMRHTKERALLGMLAKVDRLPLTGARVLDVGCGAGQFLVDCETWGASRTNLAGIDLLAGRVEHARRRLVGRYDEHGGLIERGAEIVHGDASELPWNDGSFDVVCQSMVLSSILDAQMRTDVANEMMRVLAEPGVIVSYDFFVDNPRNPNVRGVRAAEIAALFPGFRINCRRVTLLPPLSRRLVPRARLVAEILHELRFLNTHLLVLLERDAAAA
jgi:ubiquinone/menaquinone biosynthesis C-methylase UbiE